jgi:hypothetical protein
MVDLTGLEPVILFSPRTLSIFRGKAQRETKALAVSYAVRRKSRVAFVRRLPGSKFWIGGFNSADGRRVQRSTKQTSRKAALKIAEQWEEAARQRITETQAHKVISDLVETAHGKALDGATLAEHAESWLRQKKSR